MNPRTIAVIAVLAMLLFLCSCTDEPGTTSSSTTTSTEPVTTQAEPSGMDRFSKDAIEEHGCPDPDKVPSWLTIPECKE